MVQVRAQARKQASLFIAALLAPHRQLDHRQRCGLLAHAELLQLQSGKELQDNIRAIFHAYGINRVPAGCLRQSSLEKAEKRSAQWLEGGIWTIESAEVPAPHAKFHDIPSTLFAYGNNSILHKRTVGILNSRKNRHLSPRDPWIAATKAMVQAAMVDGYAAVSSYGNSAYAIVTVLAQGSPVIVVCDGVLPFMDSAEALTRFTVQYGELFNMDTTLFVSGFPPGRLPGKAERCFQRDQLVAALSSMLMVAEVRPKGNMASVLSIAEARGIPVKTSCEPANRKADLYSEVKRSSTTRNSRTNTATARLKQLAGASVIKDDLVQSAEELAGEAPFLMHYTRSCPGPWPGQTTAEYYRGLIEDAPGAEHTGFDTLMRILEQGMLRGSRKLTRGGADVICFTELFPGQLQDLNEWRPGLLRWSFEPYGIALNRDRLFDLGARPVIYAVEGLFSDLSDDLTYLFQLDETRGKSWAAEREWRIKGDLALSCFATDEILVIVPHAEEAAIVSERFGLRVGVAIGRPN